MVIVRLVSDKVRFPKQALLVILEFADHLGRLCELNLVTDFLGGKVAMRREALKNF